MHIHPGIDSGLASSEKCKFPGQFEQERSLSSCHDASNSSSLVKETPFYVFCIFPFPHTFLIPFGHYVSKRCPSDGLLELTAWWALFFRMFLGRPFSVHSSVEDRQSNLSAEDSSRKGTLTCILH